MPWSSLSSVNTALSTELNSLASGARAMSTAVVGNTATLAEFRLTVTFASAPSVNSPVSLFLLPSIDGGSTYADGGTSVDPAVNLQAATFYVQSVGTQQVLKVKDVVLPSGNFRILLRNDTGVAFSSSGNTLGYATYDAVIGAPIGWSNIDKAGAIASDVNAAPSNDPRFSRIFWDAIGSTIPSNPTTGFRWFEISPTGVPLMGWFFDGAGTWFSTELYAATLVSPPAGFFLTNPSLPSFTAQAFANFSFPYSVASGYVITSMRADVRSSVAHSGTNFINMRVRGWSLDMTNTLNTQTLGVASVFRLYNFTPTGNTIIPFTSIEAARLQLELQTQGTVTGNFIGLLRAEARLYR